MNRRNFFTNLIKGVGVFSILPPAETYSRIWKTSNYELEHLRYLEDWLVDLSPCKKQLDLGEVLRLFHAIKEKRSKMPKSDTIEIWCGQKDIKSLLYV